MSPSGTLEAEQKAVNAEPKAEPKAVKAEPKAVKAGKIRSGITTKRPAKTDPENVRKMS
jgi:hypothetical protein